MSYVWLTFKLFAASVLERAGYSWLLLKTWMMLWIDHYRREKDRPKMVWTGFIIALKDLVSCVGGGFYRVCRACLGF